MTMTRSLIPPIQETSLAEQEQAPPEAAASAMVASADSRDSVDRTLTPQITASNKNYDGTTSATILTRTFTSALTVTEDVSVTGGTATFASKTVGTGKTVTAIGLSLSGTAAAKYVLSSTSATTTANITARSLTVTASGENKVYDGTTAATVTLADNRIAGDVLTTTYTSASFADKNVGTGKAVSVSGIAISGGADPGNYASATRRRRPRPTSRRGR